MNKRAVILVRVSTDRQDPDNQIPACLALAARLGYQCDPALDMLREVVSGTKGREERPELRRVLHLAAVGEIGAVVVWALDRIGRNMWDVVDRFREIESRGVRVFSVSESWTVECPEDFRPLLLAQAAWWAGMERARIVARVKAGMDTARKRGSQIGPRRKIPLSVAPIAWGNFLRGESWAMIAEHLGDEFPRQSVCTAITRWARLEGAILPGETANQARDRLRVAGAP